MLGEPPASLHCLRPILNDYNSVGGHASGGGYGTYTSRSWGLLVDRITSMQVVTAEGTIRTLSSTSTDSDLFWVSTYPF